MSSYEIKAVEAGQADAGMDGEGERIWIITEADRSSTCLLLPEEY